MAKFVGFSTIINGVQLDVNIPRDSMGYIPDEAYVEYDTGATRWVDDIGDPWQRQLEKEIAAFIRRSR